jgi:hypothetical protein
MSTKIQSFLSASIRENPQPNPQTTDSKQNSQVPLPQSTRQNPANTHPCVTLCGDIRRV